MTDVHRAAAPNLTPAAGAAPVAGTLTFLGTATTIIRFGELTLLTDPNFLHQGQRAYLGYGLSSKRLTEPAQSIAELPHLDAILLSHLHGDHWDRVAQRGLDHDLPVLTTPRAARRLQWRGFPRATGIRTWTSHSVTRGNTTATITALPGRHAPGWAHRLLPPVMGTMLELGTVAEPAQLRVYISGDTLLVDELNEIPVRFPDIDTGVLHLGGTTLPGGLMVTMDAQQGRPPSSSSAPIRTSRSTTTTTRCSVRPCRSSVTKWTAADCRTGCTTSSRETPSR